MKKVKLSIILILVSGIVFSQGNSSFELTFQIGNSFRAFSNTSNIAVGNEIIDSKNLHEEKSNFRLEFAYNKILTDKLMLKAGINYSTFNYYTSKLSDLRWPSEHDGNGGWEPNPNLPREITDQVNYTFIGIPLLIKYELNNNRFKPLFEIGPTLKVLSGAEFEESTNLNSEISNISDEFNTINIFARAGIGIGYQTSTNLEIFGLASFQRQLNNLRKNTVIEKLYDYGISLGIRMSMHKVPSDNIKRVTRNAE